MAQGITTQGRADPTQAPGHPPSPLPARSRRGLPTQPFRSAPLRTWIPEDELINEPLQKHRSAEEIARVLDQADAEAAAGGWHEMRLRFFVYLLAYTGMHDAEARGLRRQDVDRPKSLIHIQSHPRRRLKTGARAAIVAMAEELTRAYDDWEPHIGTDPDGKPCPYIIPGWRRTGPWSGGPPGYRPLDRVRQLGARAGVDKLTIIAFRHTIGTEGDPWGFGENELQGLLRHARPTTQKHYRHRDPELLRRAVRKIHYPRQSPPLPGSVGAPTSSPGA